MRKHLCGLILILLVCLSLLALPAFAAEFAADVAEFNGNTYETLDAALNAAYNDGDTVTLLDDAQIEYGYTYADLTIEMNGHSITGDLAALGSLTLNNGTFVGELQFYGESNTITAPADADAAVDGKLYAADGVCTVSGAKIGVSGKLSITEDAAAVTISGTERAVNLTEAVDGITTVYGSTDAAAAIDEEATFDAADGNYKVGGEIAKVISNQKAGAPVTPADPTLDSDSYTVGAGASVTITVTYAGNEDLVVSIQKSAQDSTVKVENGTYSGGTWTVANDGSGTIAVTISASEDSTGLTYPVHIYPEKSVSRSVSTTVTVTPAVAKVGNEYFIDFDAAATRAAETSGTVTLLRDVTVSAALGYNMPNGTYTLDLAGYSLSVKDPYATDADALGTITTDTRAKLTIRSTGGSGALNVNFQALGDINIVENIRLEGTLEVFGNTLVDSEGYSGSSLNGEIRLKTLTYGSGVVTGGKLTLKNARIGQNVTVENHGELYVEERSGVYGVLFTSNRTVDVRAGGKLYVTAGSLNKVTLADGAYASLSGGSYDSISIGGSKKLASVLQDGYAFFDITSDAIKAANGTYLSGVRVKAHAAHTDIDLDNGTCTCGSEIDSVRMTPDAEGNLQTVEGYTGLKFALAEAQNGETVRVLGASPYLDTALSRTSKINLTLDLYGHSIQGYLDIKNVNLDVINSQAVTSRSYIRAEITVNANSVLKLCNVSAEWETTVYGRLETYAENTGDFVEFTDDLTFETGSTGSLAAGTEMSTLAMRSGTVGDVLPDGCGYVNTASPTLWLATDANILSYTTVAAAPIVSVTAADADGVYGKETALSATVVELADTAYAGVPTTYQWYTVNGGVKTEIDGATDAVYTLSANTVPGTYTYAVTATRAGFAKTVTCTVQIDRATLVEGVHFTAPTAKTLAYNGVAQALVNPGSITTGDASLAGLEFRYTLYSTESYEEDIPTGTEPGDYTVFYDIFDSNNCYKTAGEASVAVHIDPATVTIANFDYPTSIEYGKTVPVPMPENFTVTGNYKNVWMTHEWQKENGGYLTNAPTEVGKYILHLHIAATDCTKEATLTLPVEIVPNTDVQTADGVLYFNNRKSSQSGNAAISTILNRAGLNPSGGVLTLNSLTYEMAKDGAFVPYDEATASFYLSARTLGGNADNLLITVSKVSFAEDEEFARVRMNVSSANYANIEVTLKLRAIPKAEKNLDITMDDWVYGKYDASVNKPRYTVDSSAVLRETVAFRASDGAPLTEVPTDVGNYKVYVECETEDYIYSGTTGFSITRRDITNDMVVELGDTLTYNGREQEQKVKSVKLDGESIRYTIVGNTARATDAGEHTMLIKPSDDNYTGTKEVKFSILPMDISTPEVIVTLGDDLVYDTTEQTQEIVSIEYDGKDVTYTVKEGTDKATNAGLYALTIVGYGNFTGEAYISFEILPRDIAEATINLGDALTYTGNEQTQTVASVKYGGKDVTYTVKNDSDKATNAGNYTLTLVGTNNFTGEVNVPFTVAKRDIAEATVTLGDALVYDTTEQTRTVKSVRYGDVDADYTVKSGTDKATNAGNYTLTLVGGGNFTGEVDVPFTVSPKTVTATVTVIGTYIYDDGRAVLPSVKAFDGNVEIDHSEYTVECENNTDAGTAIVRLRDNADGNYTVSGETTFEILQKEQTLSTTSVTATYGESGHSVSAAGTVGAVTYTVESGSEVLDVDAAGLLTFRQGGDAVVRITAAGDKNHSAAYIDVPVRVEKAHVTLRALDMSIRAGRAIPSLKSPVLGTDYTVTGLIGDDMLEGTVTLSYAVTPNKDKAGNYEILIAHDGTDARYTADTVSGKLTVVKITGTDNTREEKSYKISLRYGEGGSVEPYGTVLVKENEDVTIRFIPDEGYKVSSVVADGSRVGAPESYTFRRVRAEHTLEVTFAKIGEVTEPVFTDVDKDSYYADAVDWAVGAGITVGASETKFAPDEACTRAQAVTFLWRAVGSPAATGTALPFTDVAADAYYREAVLWAVEKGIVKGVSATKFNPDGICTRAEIVTFLYRTLVK